MRTFDTMTSAIQTFQGEGYTANFEMGFDTIIQSENKKNFGTESFDVAEIVRFEGMTNPSDSSILFAIKTVDGTKGLLVDAYGAKSDPMSIEMIEKFQLPNLSRR